MTGVALTVAAAVSIASGCRPAAQAPPPAALTWTLNPSPPRVGPATLSVVVRDPGGAPLAGATLRLEGHMSHPGMAPVQASATEREPGVYDVPFAFTMPGDWILLVNVTLREGHRIERRIDVANVRP